MEDLFNHHLPDELKNSPCVCCENADWRLTIGGLISAYCKNRFDMVYSTKGMATDAATGIKCIELKMDIAMV